ncbi:hypothetical protein ACFVQ4_24905 [Streptomyces laurentii]|uniref:hypothetical protein n=1 Tax=Streptomyces laurentii TaxID=39478 RepID=UPI00367ED35A
MATARTSAIALTIGALALIVGTIQRDDAEWLTPALWVAWPAWIVLAAGTVWIARRQK